MIIKNGYTNSHDLPKPVLPPENEKLIELYYDAWRLAKEHVRHDARFPAPYFMDEGFCPEYSWVWDTCFMSMFCRYAADLFPGIESLDNFYAIQKEDGYITMTVQVDTGDDAYPLPHGRINPPLFAWVEWDNYKITGDSSRFERVLPHLLKLDEWIEKNRRREDGSYWFADCGSSGMDNSPRTCRVDNFGNNTNFIDLASQQAFAANCIAKIANVTGNRETAAKYLALFKKRSDFINEKLWASRDHFYYDAYLDGHFTGCKTVASFWPMQAEVAAPVQAAKLVEHLENPSEFNRPHSIPTLSYDNPNFKDDGGYWLGAVWAPTNYMVVKGLEKYGFNKQAKEIAIRHLSHMKTVYDECTPHTIWECYSSEFSRPAEREEGGRVRPDFVGWSGLGPISMLIENIIGLRIDYPAGKITWFSNEIGEHGVENLRFGPHRISVVAKARKSTTEIPEIIVEADCKVAIDFQTF